MDDLISIHEMRRRAPLHFLAKADNSRFSAYVLWHVDCDYLAAVAEQASYGGTPTVSTREAFRREAAIALELIIKAVIAQRIENQQAQQHITRVRPTHNLPGLWSDARLPKLPDPDYHRLLIAKSILIWSGRYAAPKSDKEFEHERALQEPYEDIVSNNSNLKIRRPRSFGWEDFDRIYSIASVEFWKSRKIFD